MGYYIRGFLTDKNISTKMIERYKEAKLVELYEGLYLLPMTDELYDEFNSFEISQAIGKFEMLNQKIKSKHIQLSRLRYI